MRLAMCVCLCQCIIIICDYCEFVNAKALIGANVRRAREREFPFIAALVKINATLPNVIARFCSGSIISSNSVLTAEHCLMGEILSRVQIMVGTIDFTRGRRFNAEWWISYTKWLTKSNGASGSKLHDIAILRLDNSVPASIQPARLTEKPLNYFYGLDVSIAGWGVKLNGDVPVILETVTSNILKSKECRKRIMDLHGQEVKIDSNIFCTAGNPYALLSQGDSGDPVMYNNEIIGISSGSFNQLGFHPNKVNVHVNVQYYKQFIHDIVQNF